MSVAARYGKDTITPGESFIEYRPTEPDPTKKGVIFCHGGGSLADMAQQYPAAALAIYTLVANGHRVLSTDLGGRETWGNPTSQARLVAARQYLQGPMGAPAGPFHLFGISMGGQASLVYAANNPGDVASVTAFIPVVDLTDIVTNNRQGAAANANLAYSGGWSEPVWGDHHNPITLAKNGWLSSVPIQIIYGSNDPICVAPRTEEFIAVAGNNVRAVELPSGHDMDQYTPELNQDFMDWISTH